MKIFKLEQNCCLNFGYYYTASISFLFISSVPERIYVERKTHQLLFCQSQLSSVTNERNSVVWVKLEEMLCYLTELQSLGLQRNWRISWPYLCNSLSLARFAIPVSRSDKSSCYTRENSLLCIYILADGDNGNSTVAR